MPLDELLRIQNSREFSILLKFCVLLHKIDESFSFPDDVAHGDIKIFLLLDIFHEVVLRESAIDELLIHTLCFFFGITPVQHLAREHIMLLEGSYWSIILFRVRIISLNWSIEDILLLQWSHRPIILFRVRIVSLNRPIKDVVLLHWSYRSIILFRF